MMYGHVDHPRQWLGHFRVLAGIQDVTGGFTEFVALPFIHTNAPIYLAGIARPGPTWRENRVVHAMARLLLHGRIDNIQCSWVKLGDEGTRAMLNGGCNDLGGTLMEETISRMAGSEHGSARTVAQLKELRRAGRRRRPRRGADEAGVRPPLACQVTNWVKLDATRRSGVTFRRSGEIGQERDHEALEAPRGNGPIYQVRLDDARLTRV